jgi:MinD superfamily P-loop ATPase
MREITVISGKGGAGKTSITAALASVANNIVLCDNDVDAADLHIITKPTIEKKEVFKGGLFAQIETDRCAGCGTCAEYCRYDAIALNSNNEYEVNKWQCEGCGLCEKICPDAAIIINQSIRNYWYISKTRFGKMVHAEMQPGEENSGKLVSKVRNIAREEAMVQKASYIVNDGPPGVGCSAISSVTGADLVVLVAEPTVSGLHDIQRLVELVEGFGITMIAVINKSTLHQESTEIMENYFSTKGIPVVAKIPFDKSMVKALLELKTIVEYDPSGEIAGEIKKIWQYIEQMERAYFPIIN